MPVELSRVEPTGGGEGGGGGGGGGGFVGPVFTAHTHTQSMARAGAKDRSETLQRLALAPRPQPL
jgi:hypothetical protein